MGHDDLSRIKAKFDEIWGEWGVELPADAMTTRAPGALRQKEGSGLIRYVFVEHDEEVALEYYSFHRIGGDSHARISATGAIERLDTLQTMYVLSDDPNETQRTREEMHRRNQELLEDLTKKGLLEGGPVPTSFEMNAYLVTGDRDAELNSAPKIQAVVGDITKHPADAIVNAANSTLLGGGGVDGAIHRAGGPAIRAECQKIRDASYPEGLPTGQAVATTAGALPARWVIHTVGPVYRSSPDPAAELRSCYTQSLGVAEDLGAKTIAFPAISTGAFGYPLDEAAREAVAAVKAHKPSDIEEIAFVLFDQHALAAFEAALSRA